MFLSELFLTKKTKLNESPTIVWEKRGKNLIKMFRCGSGKLVDNVKKCAEGYKDFNIPKNEKLISIQSQTKLHEK